jgi:DNA-directed RNA polymerase specialized sigma24 family protein
MLVQPLARLSVIPTAWDLLRLGSRGPDEWSRRQLLVRYQEAVRCYLLKKVGNANVADELASDFAYRVLNREDRLLSGLDPARGRFRDYLKVVLWRMAADYHRGLRKQPLSLDPEGGWEPVTEDDTTPDFEEVWRQEVVNQAWRALQAVEDARGKPYATAVRLTQLQPEIKAQELAERLTREMGRPFTAVGIRKIVERGRKMFADLLVAEVALSLEKATGEAPSPEQVAEELKDLRLLICYSRAAVERYARRFASFALRETTSAARGS